LNETFEIIIRKKYSAMHWLNSYLCSDIFIPGLPQVPIAIKDADGAVRKGLIDGQSFCIRTVNHKCFQFKATILTEPHEIVLKGKTELSAEGVFKKKVVWWVPESRS